MTYGVPLGTLSPFDLPPAIGGLTLAVTGEMVRGMSNIPNYDFTNWRGQILLIKNWEF
jgi:hypothetical protein